MDMVGWRDIDSLQPPPVLRLEAHFVVESKWGPILDQLARLLLPPIEMGS